MKRYLIFCLFIMTSSVFAEWHSWETPPEPGQKYMYVILFPCENIEDRQYLVITAYNPDFPEFQWEHNGWWDINNKSLNRWLNEGSRLLYSPNGLMRDNKWKYILQNAF